MNYYVYKITNKNTNEFYIGGRGCKIDPINDLGVKYFSSSKILKKMISNLGIESFTFIILNDKYTTWKECYDSEQYMIHSEWGNPLLINKSCYFGKKDFGIISDEIKNKISSTSKKMWQNPEIVDKIIESQKKSWSEKRKKEQSIRLKTDFWTDKRKKSHSDKLKGHKGSLKLKGVKKPDGFGEKISHKLKNKPKSILHKENLSKSRLGKKYPHIRKLTPDLITEIYNKLCQGVNYNVIKEEYRISTSMVYRIKKREITP